MLYIPIVTLLLWNILLLTSDTVCPLTRGWSLSKQRWRNLTACLARVSTPNLPFYITQTKKNKELQHIPLNKLLTGRQIMYNTWNFSWVISWVGATNEQDMKLNTWREIPCLQEAMYSFVHYINILMMIFLRFRDTFERFPQLPKTLAMNARWTFSSIFQNFLKTFQRDLTTAEDCRERSDQWCFHHT